jgi:hypothetical protein
MKERLNLTIDGALLEAMKTYAASKEMSVSELVESYFRSVTKPVQRNSILDLVDRLERPDLERLGGREEAGKVMAPGMKEGGDYGF